jgi:lysophospholipase L1-like esterase
MGGKLKIIQLPRFMLICLLLAKSALAVNATMEIYGDSLTAGFLDSTSVVSPPTLPEISSIISDLALYKLTNDENLIHKHEGRDNAWPADLAHLVEAATPNLNLTVQNLAVSGATTSELASQIKDAPDASEYGMFFIGHNDLCKDTDSVDTVAAKFSASFETAVRIWDKDHSNAKGYLIPVGQIQRVYDTLHGLVWYQGAVQYKCEDSWTKFFPYCPSYADMYANGTLDAFLGPRIDAMNNSLAALAQKMNGSSAHGNHYEYVAGIDKETYEKEYFAIDCYHLSELGQSTLAEKIYQVVGNFSSME